MPPLRLLAVNHQSVDLLLLEALLSEVLPTAEFTSCPSAAQALEYLSRVDPLPHLVLVNLHMVGLSSLDLIRQLGLDPRLRALPVIIMSGSVDPEDCTRALAAGAADYLVKPLNSAEQEKQLLHLAQTWRHLYDVP
ncbi:MULTISPECIES: response regulator [unclassified Deinococcus]|uniref:response regulator n=1 Tax=unclassified Deinococcus TaxID=2623546 RepID=UPI001C2FC75F|nr:MULTISPECIES: response regulator [unclassified Deinococcus]MDK2013506.1 response regulator [Deinococcus sp. 43]